MSDCIYCDIKDGHIDSILVNIDNLKKELSEKDNRIKELEDFIRDDVIDLIKYHDEILDGEWGKCRSFDKMLEDGDESPIYSDALKLLN